MLIRMSSPLPKNRLRDADALCHAADGFWAFVRRPRVLSVDELRTLDADAENQLGLPPAILMENAAMHAASVITRLAPSAVLIVAGPGHNGGDGFALARQLAIAGVRTHTVLVGDPNRLSPCTAINRNAAIALGLAQTLPGKPSDQTVRIERLLSGGEWDTVVDAVFGTGLSRPAAGHAARAIECINASRASGGHRITVSLDVPSGLDADRGRAEGPVVRADLTISFAASKIGFSTIDAQHALGEIALVPIGLPDAFVSRFGAPITIEPGTHWRDAHRNAAESRLGPQRTDRPAGRSAERGPR